MMLLACSLNSKNVAGIARRNSRIEKKAAILQRGSQVNDWNQCFSKYTLVQDLVLACPLNAHDSPPAPYATHAG